MYQPSKRFKLFLLPIVLLLTGLSACNTTNTNAPPSSATSTPISAYTLSGGGTCVKLGQHLQPPFLNVRVSHDSFLAHSEPMLAENPHNPLNLVGGTKFFTDLAHYRFQIGYFASFDGGCTWTDGGVLPGFQKEFTLTSDISFAFGTHNDVYAGVLYEARPGMSGIAVSKPTDGIASTPVAIRQLVTSGIAVSKSTDGGKTFGNPVSIIESQGSKIFHDKPWITVDQTNGPHKGNVYVVWSYDYGNDCGQGNPCVQELAFSRSTDGGKTFSSPAFIEGSAPFCANPLPDRPPHSTRCDAAIGAIPVVEPDGTIAVGYAVAFETILDTARFIPTMLLVTTSSDAGTTWTAPVLIARVHDVFGRFPPERYRNETLPAFACDPKTGQLYLTWSDKRSGDADILFSTSSDHGESWSLPLRVNDDPLKNGANQFQPQMAVAPDGVVSISFFDTRLDPRHRLIDVYLAQSVDQGTSFLKNVRVTTQSWDPAVDAPIDGFGNQFIGDYQGLAADNFFVHPFWNDTRTGAQEIFTAAVPSAQPGSGN